MNPKIQISEIGSSSLKPHSDVIEEISVEDFSKIMRTGFQIYGEPVSGKSYAVRYTGSPYRASSEDCKSLLVFAHAKGMMLSPLNVIAVLEKFDITQTAYGEAYANQPRRVN